MLAQAAGKVATRAGADRKTADAEIEKADAAGRNADASHPAKVWKGAVDDVPVELVVGDAARIPFPDDSFDTVVDVFGLCSVDDPVLALNEMARVCRPGGEILLLEHGRSEWQWMNEILDASAQNHRRIWGCWYNRDIGEAIRRSNIDIVDHSRWNFWTTHVVRAKPAAVLGSSASSSGDGGRQ